MLASESLGSECAPINGRALSTNVNDPRVRNRVVTLLSATYPGDRLHDRRSEPRYPYPNLVHLSPLAGEDGTQSKASIVVVGKHLSVKGLGFFHRDPLAHRLMIASLEAGSDHWLGLLIDIFWCRFTRHGWYESGGRFLRAIDSPAA